MFIKKILAHKALETMREKMINPKIADIAKIKSMEWREGKLFLTFTFNGLEDREIKVICKKIEIAPDNSSISLSGFESDMPFVENALNAFASGTHKLPEGGMTRIGVAMARKILDL